MMVINASYNPGIFFQTDVNGLCPNTTYQFAAWIYNVLQPFACNGNGIKPNLTFSIETPDGKVLNSYQTGDIPTDAGWIQYGLFFTTKPGESTVVLKMVNNAPGGCGNDLLLDDITFRACGPLVSASIAGVGDSANVCTGDNTVFTINANVSAGYNDPVYQWQTSTDDGATWQSINGATDTIYTRRATTVTGKYLYRLAVSEKDNINIASCSILSNVVSVGVNKYPVPAAAARGSCIGDTLYLSANDGSVFSWTGPLNFSSNAQYPFIPSTSAGNSGKYYVSVTSAEGCTSIDSATARLFVKPTVDAGSDAAICEGRSIQLNSTGSNNITSYNWAPPSSLSNASIPDPVASPIDTTEYILTVANNDCTTSDSVLITVYKKPIADAGPDKVIIKGQSTMLDGNAGGTNVSYLWKPDVHISSLSVLEPIVNPDSSQVYTLNVASGIGCGTDIDSVLVKVYLQVFIPNAFTPNGDGINDTWYIETLLAYPGAEVRVYNRYGQVVFDNHGQPIWWDGKLQGQQLSSGAYAYVIDLKNNMPLLKGVVYLLL